MNNDRYPHSRIQESILIAFLIEEEILTSLTSAEVPLRIKAVPFSRLRPTKHQLSGAPGGVSGSVWGISGLSVQEAVSVYP